MNTKNNQRFKDTENKIIDALLHLSNHTSMEKVTVSDICRYSHTNRSTFYAHFQDIPDLLEHINFMMRKELMNTFPSSDYKEVYASGEFIEPFLTFVKEHQNFYRACLSTRTTFPIKQGYDELMELVVRPICLEHGIISETQMYYSLTYVQAGFTSILKNWVKDGCTEEISEIEQYLKTCMHFSCSNFS